MTVVDYTTKTAAEIVALIEAEQVWVDLECDLLDSDSAPIESITDDVIASGSSVEYGAYNTIHRTCTLAVSRELQWGSQRVKPYMLLSSDNTDWVRWPLGVFVLETPQRVVTGSDTPTWEVQGYDLLQVLNTPLGASYTLPAGDAIIPAVEALIVAAGETSSIDQTAAATVAATTVSFNFLEEEWTTLTVCNALLDQVGYRALHADRNGVFRSAPYRSPEDLPSVWSFSTASATTSVGEVRTHLADYFNAPNEIVGVNDSLEEAIPVEGAGIYTLSNDADGPTSKALRGRTIRQIVRGQYADQAALVTAVTQSMDAAKRVTEIVEITSSPNPTFGHFNAVSLRDDDIPVNGRFLLQSWSLPFGGDMSLTLRGV